MQVLKDEIMNSILLSAKTQFLQCGYEKTSMERIAKSAGISKSNLYNYFKGKDELFYCLVDKTAFHFQKMINFFVNNEFEPVFTHPDFPKMMTKTIFTLIISNREGLLLLALCSKGTKYENLVDQLSSEISNKFKRDYPQQMQTYDLLSNVISKNLFGSIIEITRCCEDEQKLYGCLEKLIQYHTFGFKALIAE